MKRFLSHAGLAVALLGSIVGCSSTSASGSNGKKLTLLKPVNQTLKRGDTNKVAITVVRENIDADVSVRFDNLPEGVKVIETDKKVKDDEFLVNYTLFAANDAGLVSGQVVKVTVEGPEGLAATESFEVTVKE
ncbi:MAG: hypothetical protein FD180_2742 [Planctomycetota bacterium]|nr:MAG: hypothetical protein FD180_2742 [Planctomycetota bacterium]